MVIKNCLICQKKIITYPSRLKIGKGQFCSKKCYGIRMKGIAPLFINNLGKKLSDDHKRKISNSNLGKIPWNKGIKGIMTAWNKGISIPEDIKRNFCRGEDHPMWKGNNVSYSALHEWVKYYLGKPSKCEFCGKDNLIGRQIHWANKSHEYKRDLTDWLRLCRLCHERYDGKGGYLFA